MYRRMLVLLALCALSCSATHADTSYTLHDLGTFGGLYAKANRINASGTIVGQYTTSSGQARAFYWNGALHDLGAGEAFDINDSGTIVGRLGSRAVKWENGISVDLGPGAATAINNIGEIVGGDGVHAFLLSNGTKLDLGTLGGSTSSASAINDTGLVVGLAHLPGFPEPVRATLWFGGNKQNLGTFGGTTSSANDVNNNGIIVGNAAARDPYDNFDIGYAFYWDGSLHQIIEGGATGINDSGVVVGRGPGFQGFVYTNGSVQSLPGLGGNTVPSSISNSGVIVGSSVLPGGSQHAVYWTLVPEPSAISALAVMLSGLAVAGKRRH